MGRRKRTIETALIDLDDCLYQIPEVRSDAWTRENGCMGAADPVVGRRPRAPADACSPCCASSQVPTLMRERIEGESHYKGFATESRACIGSMARPGGRPPPLPTPPTVVTTSAVCPAAYMEQKLGIPKDKVPELSMHYYLNFGTTLAGLVVSTERAGWVLVPSVSVACSPLARDKYWATVPGQHVD